jgi:hypothetical protein
MVSQESEGSWKQFKHRRPERIRLAEREGFIERGSRPALSPIPPGQLVIANN